MSRYITAYIATLIAFVAMDFVWLSTMTTRLYLPDIGALMLPKPHMAPAAAFYLLFIVGIVVFAVKPALDKRQWRRAALLGALFGFLAYATFDLTSLASLKGFTIRVALVDMAWGAVVSGVAASAGYQVAHRIG